MSARDQFLTINHLRLHYREWGAPPAPAVLLLHGGSAHAHWWDQFAAAISDAYHVLALDLRGHGDSAAADPPAYRIEDYADDVRAWVETLGLPRFDVIGHSLGGLVAVRYAGTAPERLRSLVIVDSQVRIGAAGARYMLRLRHFPHPLYRTHEQAISRFRLLPTQTNAAPETLATIAAHSVRQLADGRWTLKFDRESLAHAEPQDLLPIVQRLSIPVLFVRGAHSTLLPRDKLDALLAAVPGARGVEIPGAHHHVMLDNPAVFARVVRGFLDAPRADAP